MVALLGLKLYHFHDFTLILPEYLTKILHDKPFRSSLKTKIHFFWHFSKEGNLCDSCFDSCADSLDYGDVRIF